eukprot:Nk52_evm13s319 gene=Nk52_evmTU13s319
MVPVTTSWSSSASPGRLVGAERGRGEGEEDDEDKEEEEESVNQASPPFVFTTLTSPSRYLRSGVDRDEKFEDKLILYSLFLTTMFLIGICTIFPTLYPLAMQTVHLNRLQDQTQKIHASPSASLQDSTSTEGRPATMYPVKDVDHLKGNGGSHLPHHHRHHDGAPSTKKRAYIIEYTDHQWHTLSRGFINFVLLSAAFITMTRLTRNSIALNLVLCSGMSLLALSHLRASSPPPFAPTPI